jgi:hypothetical protein
MAGDSKRIFKFFIDNVNKLPLFLNTKSVVKNANERTQYKLSNLQNIASEKFSNTIKV